MNATNNVLQSNPTSSSSLGFGNVEGKDFEALARAEKLVLVQHNFELWTGQAVMADEDYNIAEGKSLLKEQDTKAASGQKWLIDRTLLSPFKASKKRFLTKLAQTGVRFMGGYAVPLDRWDELKSDLDEEVRTFDRLKGEFLASYDGAVEAWALAHPQIAESIRAAKPDRYDLENRISSGYLGVRLNPVTPADQKAFEKAIDGLAGQLVSEVVTEAVDYQRSSLKADVKLVNVNRLLIIKEKLKGLSFLAGGILPFAELLNRELLAMKASGKMDNSPESRARLLALVGILANRALLTEIVLGKVSMTEVSNRLGGVRQTIAPVAMPAPAPVETKPLPVQEKVEVAPVIEAKPEVKAEPVAKTAPAVFDEPDLFAEMEALTVPAEPIATEVPEGNIDPDEFEALLAKDAEVKVEVAVEAKADTTEEVPETKEEPKAPLYVQSSTPAKAATIWF